MIYHLDIERDVLKIYSYFMYRQICVGLLGQMCGLELIRAGLSLRGDEKITSAIRQPDVFAIREEGGAG